MDHKWGQQHLIKITSIVILNGLLSSDIGRFHLCKALGAIKKMFSGRML